MNPSQFNIGQYLSVLPLFSSLSCKQLQGLEVGCTIHSFSRGSPIFVAGEVCEAFYIVVTGKVKLFVTTPTGLEKVIVGLP